MMPRESRPGQVDWVAFRGRFEGQFINRTQRFRKNTKLVVLLFLRKSKSDTICDLKTRLKRRKSGQKTFKRKKTPFSTYLYEKNELPIFKGLNYV